MTYLNSRCCALSHRIASISTKTGIGNLFSLGSSFLDSESDFSSLFHVAKFDVKEISVFVFSAFLAGCFCLSLSGPCAPDFGASAFSSFGSIVFTVLEVYLNDKCLMPSRTSYVLPDRFSNSSGTDS